jgi:hypothetical protein
MMRSGDQNGMWAGTQRGIRRRSWGGTGADCGNGAGRLLLGQEHTGRQSRCGNWRGKDGKLGGRLHS